MGRSCRIAASCQTGHTSGLRGPLPMAKTILITGASSGIGQSVLLNTDEETR
jgi:NADP-dependent 3-hydroxy acid dehydrogenase YdfG